MGTHLLNTVLLAQESHDRLPEIPDNYIALAFFLMVAVVGVIAICATAWVSARKSFHVTALKEKMIERGMSVAEIERVLAAGTKKGCSPSRSTSASTAERDLPPQKPQAGPHPSPHPSPMAWPSHSQS